MPRPAEAAGAAGAAEAAERRSEAALRWAWGSSFQAASDVRASDRSIMSGQTREMRLDCPLSAQTGIAVWLQTKSD